MILRRALTLALLAVGIAALSCHFGSVPGDSVENASAPAARSGDPMAAELWSVLRARHTGLASWEEEALATTIVEEARRNGLDPGLVFAVIQVESGCYNLAVSPVGALGLMQILPSTGKELASKLGVEWAGPDTLFDPTVNVRLGVAYLSQLANRYESVHVALAAYNWGPGQIDRRLRRGSELPSLYVRQVFARYDGASRS